MTERPAFYALAPGGWRDYVTLLHPPYTLWHVSYVAAGAGLSARFSWTRFALTLAAFVLALGVGAHALDELRGRPLQTRIPDAVLWMLALLSIAAGTALGVYGCVVWTPWLAPLVVFGVFVVAAYNLEWFGGLFHSALWFALAWGALPALTAYTAQAERVRVETVVLAAYATLLSSAQRVLSTPVRDARRRVLAVSGTIVRSEGDSPVTRETLVGSQEAALRLLTGAAVALGAALVLRHV